MIWRLGFHRTHMLLTLVALLMLAACQNSAPQTPTAALQIGMQAPPIELVTVQGDDYTFGGDPVLLAFLNTQTGDNNLTADLSRSQVVFLKSIEQQYGDDLEVAIVDASALITGTQPDTNSLINFSYDWKLEGIPVLVDAENETAHRFGVSSLPTTFLIDADGTIRQRWGGFAAAAQLDMAVQEVFGVNIFGTPIASDTCSSTPAQAKFPGMALTRPLSDQIWVVDRGEAWGEGVLMRWLILAPAGEDLTLRVSGSAANGDVVPIIQSTLVALPEDEAEVLSPDPAWGVYELAALLIDLPDAPCLQVEASITNVWGDEIAAGSAIVPIAPNTP